MVVIVGFGNPLLDITVKIPDNKLLDEYNLNADDQEVFTPTKMKSLLQDIMDLNQTVSPGGAAQNTLRILHWILPNSNSINMFGGIGRDEMGKNLKELVERSGVITRYVQHETEPTGTAVALISGTYRSLVADIGASKCIGIEDLQTVNAECILKTTNLIYMEGFFLPHRIPLAKYIRKLCRDKNIIFMFNLSAVFLATAHPKEVMYFAKKCDILIGNNNEYEALIKVSQLKCDVQTFLTDLSRNSKLKRLKYGKIAIVTNGSKSVMCTHSMGKLEQTEVPKIDSSKIGDTTGAGDAFAAGFIAGLLAEHPPATCLKWGCGVSQQIIQQIGCTIPEYDAYEFLNAIK